MELRPSHLRETDPLSYRVHTRQISRLACNLMSRVSKLYTERREATNRKAPPLLIASCERADHRPDIRGASVSGLGNIMRQTVKAEESVARVP